MKICHCRLRALVAGAAFAVCVAASFSQTVVEQRVPELRIYTSSEINTSRYEVVGRPWVDSWRSAFWIPTFPSEQEAIAALRTEAASRGADGLLNVTCFGQGHRQWQWSGTEPGYLCYGTAIRVRASGG